MSSKPDKSKYGETTEDPNQNMPGRQGQQQGQQNQGNRPGQQQQDDKEGIRRGGQRQ